MIISKGKKYTVVTTRDIHLKDVYDCFRWSRRRNYIGVNWNLFESGTEGYELIEEFLDFVASKAKRWWTPYWFLNLLHLFGEDNSIVRCRSAKLSNLIRKLRNGILITDIKEKYGTLRIYGYGFDPEIDMVVTKLEAKISPMLLEAYGEWGAY